jgi:hypothetical protein
MGNKTATASPPDPPHPHPPRSPGPSASPRLRFMLTPLKSGLPGRSSSAAYSSASNPNKATSAMSWVGAVPFFQLLDNKKLQLDTKDDSGSRHSLLRLLLVLCSLGRHCVRPLATDSISSGSPFPRQSLDELSVVVPVSSCSPFRQYLPEGSKTSLEIKCAVLGFQLCGYGYPDLRDQERDAVSSFVAAIDSVLLVC